MFYFQLGYWLNELLKVAVLIVACRNLPYSRAAWLIAGANLLSLLLTLFQAALGYSQQLRSITLPAISATDLLAWLSPAYRLCTILINVGIIGLLLELQKNKRATFIDHREWMEP